jgi:hypothetical protein
MNKQSPRTDQEALVAAMRRDAEIVRARVRAGEVLYEEGGNILSADDINAVGSRERRNPYADEHIFSSAYSVGRR